MPSAICFEVATLEHAFLAALNFLKKSAGSTGSVPHMKTRSPNCSPRVSAAAIEGFIVTHQARRPLAGPHAQYTMTPWGHEAPATITTPVST